MNLILLAAERPEILESAIFVHGAASFTQEDMQVFAQDHPELMQDWAAMEQELAADELAVAEKTDRMKAFWLGEYFPAALARPDVSAPLLEEAFADAEFSWVHAQYANQETPTFDARDTLPGIVVRSLVLAGGHDMIPADRVLAFAQALQDGRYVLFADSGHFAPIEQGMAFRQAVLEFLGVIEPPPSVGFMIDDDSDEADEADS
jgi:pimeloyl-ACP methyl ester carboxylesterase